MSSKITIKGTIASGGTTSGEINFTRSIPQGIIFPAAMVGTNITFTNSAESTASGNSNFVPVRNSTVSAAATSTTSYTITVTGNTSAQIPLDPYVAKSLAYSKVVSQGTETTDVNFFFICREGDSIA